MVFERVIGLVVTLGVSDLISLVAFELAESGVVVGLVTSTGFLLAFLLSWFQ